MQSNWIHNYSRNVWPCQFIQIFCSIFVPIYFHCPKKNQIRLSPVFPLPTRAFKQYPHGPFASFNNKRSSKASRPGNVSQAYPKVGFFTSSTLSFVAGENISPSNRDSIYLLMVQKSCKLTSWGTGSWKSHYLQVWDASQVVVWISSIKSSYEVMIIYHKFLTTIFVANMHLQIFSPLGKRMASNSHVYIGWFIMARYYSQPLLGEARHLLSVWCTWMVDVYR